MTIVTDNETGSPTCGQQVDVMTTGEVTTKIGFAVAADFLKSLGTKPVSAKGAATYWRTSDFPAICEAIVAHVLSKL